MSHARVRSVWITRCLSIAALCTLVQPVTALRNRGYQTMFNFTHFNPVQTQFFHALYHTDTNVLVGTATLASLPSPSTKLQLPPVSWPHRCADRVGQDCCG